MQFTIYTQANLVFAELLGDEVMIRTPEDGTDLIGNAYFQQADVILLHACQLSPDFFDLRTGLAGEILQKCSNYRMRMVVLGDFSAVESRSLRDFIRESNERGQIRFLAEKEQVFGSCC